MATLSHTQWWFVSPKSAGDHQGVIRIKEFPSPRTLARHRQGCALTGCNARQFGSRLLIGYSQLTYDVHTHAYTRRYA